MNSGRFGLIFRSTSVIQGLATGERVHRVSLSGTLESMPLTDLLEWIDAGKKTGTLQVHGVRFTKTLVTRGGEIIASSSTDPNDHLGHFLLRQGQITEEILKQAMETQRKSRVMLGKILVMAGAVSDKDLHAALVNKAEETIFSLFLWESGRFDFTDGDVPDRIQVPLALSVRDVLLKGLTWYDELKKIKAVFASARSVVARTTKAVPPSLGDAGSLSHRILEMVDGRHSIADICLEAHASEFAVGKVLNLLLDQGFIEVREKSPIKMAAKPERPVESLLDEARSLVRAGEAHAAIGMLAEARRAEPEHPELKTAWEEARAAFVHQAYRDGLKPESVPSLLKPIQALTSENLTPEEMFLLSRINGTWDVRSIMSVCPFPEPDALLQLKHLKDRGLIGLQVTA